MTFSTRAAEKWVCTLRYSEALPHLHLICGQAVKTAVKILQKALGPRPEWKDCWHALTRDNISALN